MSRRASMNRKSVRVEVLESRRLLSSSGEGALQELITMIETIGNTTAWYVEGDTQTDSSGNEGKHDWKDEKNGEDNQSEGNSGEPDDVEVNPVDTTPGIIDNNGDIVTTPPSEEVPPFSNVPVIGPIDTTVETPIDTTTETPIDTTTPPDVLIPTDEPITEAPVIDPIDFTDPTDHLEEPVVIIEPEQPILSDPIDLTDPLASDDRVEPTPVETVTEPVEPVSEPVAQLPTDHDSDNKGHGNKDKHENKGKNGSLNHTVPPTNHSNDIETTASNNHSGHSGSNNNVINGGNNNASTVTSPQAPPTETAPTPTAVAPPATTTEPASTPAPAAEQVAAKQSTTQEQTASSSSAATPITTPVATPVQPEQPASSAAAASPVAIVDAAAATAVPVGAGTILSAEQAEAQAQEAKNNPMLKAVWTFAVEQPLQRVRVVRAQAAAASLAASTISVDPILKVVHELTMATPSFALPAGEGEAAGAPTMMGHMTAGQVQFAAALSESSSMSRSIILALAAGSAVMAVQWYRARQKKLADQAIKLAALMQFDPLAVWLDDP